MSKTLAMSLEIDTSNIVDGSRSRRKTRRLVDSKEWQDDYERLVLDDVPQEELVAALVADVTDDAEIESEEDDHCGDKMENEDDFIVNSSDECDSGEDEFISMSEDDDEDDDEDDEENCTVGQDDCVVSDTEDE